MSKGNLFSILWCNRFIVDINFLSCEKNEPVAMPSASEFYSRLAGR